MGIVRIADFQVTGEKERWRHLRGHTILRVLLK